MRLQAARGRVAARTWVETPGDEADQLGIVNDVLDQPDLVAAAVPIRVSHLGADLGAAWSVHWNSFGASRQSMPLFGAAWGPVFVLVEV
jgi:hypothetical protein